jgi:hypothetical protein
MAAMMINTTITTTATTIEQTRALASRVPDADQPDLHDGVGH